MRYDPILCMMVDDTVKTEDAMFVQLKFGSGRTEGAKLEENEYREYAEALLKKYGEKRVTLSKQGKVIVTYTNPNDSKTIDKAIRSCDGYKIVETIGNKNGYGLYIIETEYGKRIVLTFKGETVNNPHMWLGTPTAANISKAKSVFNDFVK